MANYKKRLKTVQAELSKYESATLLLSNPPQVKRSIDTFYPYRPDSTVYYLTGIKSPAVTILITPDEINVFAEPRSELQVLWDGELIHDSEQSLSDYVASLGSKLRYESADEIKKGIKGSLFYQVGNTVAASVAEELFRTESRYTSREFFSHDKITGKMRAYKDDEEISLIRASIATTWRHLQELKQQGFLEIGVSELDIANKLTALAIAEGSYPAFAPIVAAGKNGAVIHYHNYIGKIEEGKTLLLDFGIEQEMYCSDITRTLPVAKFSNQQRDIYQMLLEVKEVAQAHCQIGASIFGAEAAARVAYVEKIRTLGIVTSQIEDDIAKGMKPSELPIDDLTNAIYMRFGCHYIVAHLLGIDVHDTNFLKDRVGQCFGAGMVLTVEPGYYLKDELGGFAPVGMRIEDDILITAAGYENLSTRIPISIGEIENFMA